MNKIFKTSKLLYAFVILAFSFSFTSNIIEAQESSKPKKQIKYKKARALSTSTAKKMAKVYEALEVVDDKGEPAPDMEVVLEILTALRDDKENLKSYDRSVMWNTWGYVYFSDGNYDKAIQAYENLLAEPEVTIPLRTSGLLTLAQLNLVKERYQKGVDLILIWMDEIETVTAQSWSLLGQAYYALGDFKKSRSSMESAISLAELEGYKPKENWYNIMAAAIGELKKRNRRKESIASPIRYLRNLGKSLP